MANKIIPLILLAIVVILFAVIGFVVYTVVQDISNKTKASMEKKHISITKDGMKVSMKEVNYEDYKDQTQGVLVKVWNNTSFPAYRSRLWDTGATPAKGRDATKRH